MEGAQGRAERGGGVSDIDAMIERQRERLAQRDANWKTSCRHEWGTGYPSSSGRQVCILCGVVTDAPFEALGVADNKERSR